MHGANIGLTVHGRVSRIDVAGFRAIATEAKASCPILRSLVDTVALSVEATLD